MNILYMHTHDSGRCWQPYGAPIPMPHTMALAREGVTFRRAFCAGPTCSPSRAALMSGMPAHSCGMLGLAHRGFSLKDSARTIPGWFSAHGFETVLCGVQHEAANDRDLAYERILPHTPWLGLKLDQSAWDRRNAGLAADYLKERHDRPFFLSYGMLNSHRPYPDHRARGLDPGGIAPPPAVPDTADTRADMADLHCAMTDVDDCVGTVLSALRETGLVDDTVVILTTDHGIAWPNMKCTLYDGGIGVGLIIRRPGQKRPGSVTDRLVSQVDLFPTLCALTGVPCPDWARGVSLLPAADEDRPVREAVYAEINYHAAYEPMRCVRTDTHKLIVRYDDRLLPVAPNIDNSPAKQALFKAGWMARPLPREELYDLKADPAERFNRIGDPAYSAASDALHARLLKWMRDTDDPLLLDLPRVPAPPGAKVNRRDGYDPELTPFE